MSEDIVPITFLIGLNMKLRGSHHRYTLGRFTLDLVRLNTTDELVIPEITVLAMLNADIHFDDLYFLREIAKSNPASQVYMDDLELDQHYFTLDQFLSILAHYQDEHFEFSNLMSHFALCGLKSQMKKSIEYADNIDPEWVEDVLKALVAVGYNERYAKNLIKRADHEKHPN